MMLILSAYMWGALVAEAKIPMVDREICEYYAEQVTYEVYKGKKALTLEATCKELT